MYFFFSLLACANSNQANPYHQYFQMFKCLGHEEALGLIEKLRNLPGVEEINTQIVLDRIKEDHSIIIP